MPNMSYCRMENTYNDLLDAYEHMDDAVLSASEEKYKDKIIKLCKRITNAYEDDED
jgi:hypothetical protein